MRLSITQKFSLLLIPLFLLGAVVGHIAWSRLAHPSEELANANQIKSLSQNSQLYVSEMGSALKGYLLSGDETEAKAKLAADDKNLEAISSLEKLTADPQMLALITQMGEFDEKELNPAENEVLKIAKAGKTVEAQRYFNANYLPLRAKYNALSKDLTERASTVAAQQIELANARMRNAAVTVLMALIVGLSSVAGIMLLTTARLTGTLKSIVQRLSSDATFLSTSSSTISEMSTSLSGASTEQAAALQQTAASIEQVSAMVNRNSESSEQARTSSEQSRQRAQRGQEVVDEMMNSIAKIGDSNAAITNQVRDSNARFSEIVAVINDIGNKTKVINDIVFQTKLLSFNASVEAARAGEAGKGFAVVAEEVGNLAQMSGNSAKEIAAMLEKSTQTVQSIASESQTKVDSLLRVTQERLTEGTATATRCRDVLREIVNDTEKVGQLTDQIATASKEQASGVREINQAISQMDTVTQTNAASSQRSASAAGELNDRAASLRDLVTNLYKTIHGREPEPSSDHETAATAKPRLHVVPKKAA